MLSNNREVTTKTISELLTNVWPPSGKGCETNNIGGASIACRSQISKAPSRPSSCAFKADDSLLLKPDKHYFDKLMYNRPTAKQAPAPLAKLTADTPFIETSHSLQFELDKLDL